MILSEKFFNNLKDNLAIPISDKILLAVSGGADSVAMLDLFSKSPYKFGIAHCNFHLRGADSDGDEKFVKQLSEFYHAPVYSIDFDTITFAEQNGISIEMAARQLRYEWFEKIRQQHHYKYIATAHHQDDVIETFFINLTRGTGIRGLSGIKEKSETVIRPMLFCNRNSILDYIKDNKLEYREDITNSDIKIIRNRFRHQILPLLKEINPAAEENILHTIENLKGAETIMAQTISELQKDLGINENDLCKIEIKKLIEITPLSPYLFELLKPYGFNSSQIKDIESALNGSSGKTFYSTTHLLVKDRNELIISPLNENILPNLFINDGDREIELFHGQKLKIKKIIRDTDFKIPTDPSVAAFDLDKIKFPLTIKGWEPGDYFYPLGMKKKKKLSDFFIDEKMSLLEKQETWLLVSDNQIAWVIGKRIDNRFKITNKTKKMVLLKIVGDSF